MRTAREVAVVIWRAERVLVLHRQEEDYWHVVAGVVEHGEDFASAAKRELREETGLDAEVRDVGMPQSYRIPPELRHEYEPQVDSVAVRSFDVRVPAAWEPVLNEEHDEYLWLSRDEAAQLLFWPEPAQLLRALP